MTPPIAASMEKNGGGPSTAPVHPARPHHATSLATTGPEARNNRQARRLFGIPNR